MNTPEGRGAIPSHSTDTDTGSWNGPANEARLSNDAGAGTYRRAFAWVDSNGDADVKSSYKFIHHEVSSDGSVGAANTRACSAGIAVLNGGRGGANIPDGDRRGVWNHLARHLRDAGMEPPELKSLERTNDGEQERRAVQEAIEFREGDNNSATISGYAAVFNQETVIGAGMFGFREQIAQGAFDEAIKQDDVRALFNHDPNILLGRTASGTLTLASDKRGLKYTVDLPDTVAARDVRELVRRGDVSGSSFGFIVQEDKWKDPPANSRELPLRTILKASLFDVSPVTYPAYPQTSVSARSQAKAIAETIQQTEAAKEAAKSPERKALDEAKAKTV